MRLDEREREIHPVFLGKQTLLTATTKKSKTHKMPMPLNISHVSLVIQEGLFT